MYGLVEKIDLMIYGFVFFFLLFVILVGLAIRKIFLQRKNIHQPTVTDNKPISSGIRSGKRCKVTQVSVVGNIVYLVTYDFNPFETKTISLQNSSGLGEPPKVGEYIWIIE